MLNTSQHHQQVLDDHIREDATLKRWEDEDRWIGWFIKNLAGAARRVGLGKQVLPSRPPRTPLAVKSRRTNSQIRRCPAWMTRTRFSP